MIQDVINLNNQGVHHLQSGDHELARLSFKEALERTTHLLTLKEQQRVAEEQEQERRRLLLLRSHKKQVYFDDLCSSNVSHSERMEIEKTITSSSFVDHGTTTTHENEQQKVAAAAAVALSFSSGSTATTTTQQHPSDAHYTHRIGPGRGESHFLGHNTILQVPMSPSLSLQKPGVSFMCNQVFFLSSLPFPDQHHCWVHPSTSDEYCHRESVVIMYNLALVNHWHGMRYGITSLLYKALRLYEMSFTLIQQHDRTRGTGVGSLSFSTFSEETYHHLKLALLNNMGQIHFELMFYGRAKRCFDLLRVMLAGQNRQQRMQMMQPDVLQGFLTNIMFLEAPDVAPAA